MNTIDTVKEICVEQLLLDIKYIKEDSLIIEDLGADSLDKVEVIIAIEEEFDINISTKESLEIFKVSDYVEVIEKKIKETL